MASTPETNFPGKAIANASNSGFFGRLAAFTLVQIAKITADILQIGDKSVANGGNGSLPTEIQGGFRFPIVAKSAAYPATVDDATIICDTTAAGFTVTLPDPAATTPKQLMAVKKVAAGNILTVATAAGNIDGVATVAIAGLNDSTIFQSDGTNWKILANSISFGKTLEWLKFTVTAANLSAAALTNNILLYNLPAGSVLHATKLKHSLIFSGTGITSYKIGIGLVGDLQRYQSFFEVAVAVGNTVLNTSMVMDCQDQAAATAIQTAAVSVGGNLNAAAIAGSADIWLLVSSAL